MDWAILWRAGFAAACAGWFVTVLVALRSRRLLREHSAAQRSRDTDPEGDTLRMLRVDLLAEEGGAASADTVVSDATELLARLRSGG
jgi:hypothetical protein